jgi:hypothetical protein
VSFAHWQASPLVKLKRAVGPNAKPMVQVKAARAFKKELNPRATDLKGFVRLRIK